MWGGERARDEKSQNATGRPCRGCQRPRHVGSANGQRCPTPAPICHGFTSERSSFSQLFMLVLPWAIVSPRGTAPDACAAAQLKLNARRSREVSGVSLGQLMGKGQSCLAKSKSFMELQWALRRDKPPHALHAWQGLAPAPTPQGKPSAESPPGGGLRTPEPSVTTPLAQLALERGDGTSPQLWPVRLRPLGKPWQRWEAPLLLFGKKSSSDNEHRWRLGGG